MVQIDLKKLREMQGKQDAPTQSTPTPLEVITYESDTASPITAPELPAAEPATLVSEDAEAEPLTDATISEQTPVIETTTESTGIKLQLSDLHKRPTENLEVLSRQEREKELTEVFGDIVSETEWSSSSTSPDTTESTSHVEKEGNSNPKNNGFFPSLSFISEPPAPVYEKSAWENTDTIPLATSAEEEGTLITQAQEVPPQGVSIPVTLDTPSSTPQVVSETSETMSWSENLTTFTEDTPTAQVSTDGQNTPTPENTNKEGLNSIMSPMPPPVTTPPSADNLHPTNKKSLFLVLWALTFMLACGAGVFAWVSMGWSSNNTPTPPTSSVVESKTPDTSSGETQSGSMGTGSTEGATGSLSQTGTSMAQSGSELPVSSGATITGVVNTGSSIASGTTIASWSTKPASLSGTSIMSGSTIIKPNTTSTGTTTNLMTQSGSSSVNISTTGSTQPTGTPAANIKYQEGKDYKVYGGGYKLIRNEP